MIDTPPAYGPASAASEAARRHTRPARVFLANQPRLMRESLARLLERTPGLELAGAAASTTGLARAAREADADCVVVPLGPGTRTDTHVEALLERSGAPRVVALSYDGQRAWEGGRSRAVRQVTLSGLLALLRGARPEASTSPDGGTDPGRFDRSIHSIHTHISMSNQTFAEKTATEQQVEGAWQQLTGRVKEAWGVLTDDDMQRAQGKKERLVGIIEEKTGEARESIADMLDSFEQKIRNQTFDTSDQKTLANEGRTNSRN